MPQTSKPFSVNTSFEPETGNLVTIAPGVQRVTAPNASAYTFTGTNSFLLGTGAEIGLLDPGPVNGAHRQALLEAIGNRRVLAIVLTHTHRDHSASARELADQMKVPLWFGGPHRLSRPLRFMEFNPLRLSCDWDLVPDRTLGQGDVVEFGDLALETITTPGHCANHLAFGIKGTPYLLSGDHVMGWSSTLVAVPDGSMADYFASLEKLQALPYSHYIPAHGAAIVEGRAYAKSLMAHRHLRNEQILAALGERPHSLGELLNLIYQGLPAANRRAATMTLRAHLEYLGDLGRVRAILGLMGRRYALG